MRLEAYLACLARIIEIKTPVTMKTIVSGARHAANGEPNIGIKTPVRKQFYLLPPNLMDSPLANV